MVESQLRITSLHLNASHLISSQPSHFIFISTISSQLKSSKLISMHRKKRRCKHGKYRTSTSLARALLSASYAVLPVGVILRPRRSAAGSNRSGTPFRTYDAYRLRSAQRRPDTSLGRREEVQQHLLRFSSVTHKSQHFSFKGEIRLLSLSSFT